jgi:predicted secreted protein
MISTDSFISAFVSRFRPPAADARGKRFVAVIECLLNQNARDQGAAVFPAVNAAVLELCAKHGVGLLQIPCPEIRLLGLKRKRPPGMSIRACLDKQEGRQCCREISAEVMARVRDYQDQGVELLAVLGGNPESPGCAVHPGTAQGQCDAASGILMQTLAEAFEAASIRVPFKAIRDYRSDLLEVDLHWLERRFLDKATPPRIFDIRQHTL